jgi:hypothetical protein
MHSFINEEHVEAGSGISFAVAMSKRTPIGVSHSRTKCAEVGHFGLLKPRTKPPLARLQLE